MAPGRRNLQFLIPNSHSTQISSPEPAGNVREASGTLQTVNFPEIFRCETKNQDGDIFWNSRIRSSEKGGGIGKIKVLNGPGKYKKYIGLECPYGIVYQAEHAWF